MTWAEHVARIGTIAGVSTKLGHDPRYLGRRADRLRTSPVILGQAEWYGEPDEDGIFRVPLPDYDSRTVKVHGKVRNLLVPIADLGLIQAGIRDLLGPAAEELLRPACHGYRPAHSTVSNAATHCGATRVQKLDIQDFFGSTTPSMVVDMFEQIGFDAGSARLLTGLATVNDALPLGSPCSPVISNLILAAFDEEVECVAADQGVAYTRYADDMTFSANTDFDLAEAVGGLLAARGYQLSPKKAVTAIRGQNLTVTGLVIWDGRSPRLPKSFRRRLETELYFISRYGLEDHAFREYSWDWIDADEEPERHVEYTAIHLRGKVRYALGVQRGWMKGLLRRYPEATRLVIGEATDAEDRRGARIAFMQQLARNVRARTTAPASRLVD